MATTPDPNASFVREVDEQVRRERIGNIFQRYGKIMLAVLAIVLAAAIGYAVWQNRQAKAADAQSEVLDKVITDLAANSEKGVAPQLARLAGSDSPGYRAAALLTRADLALGRGQNAAAAAIFKTVADDAAMPKAYRDLALVRQTAAEFDTIAPALVIQRLEPLAKAGNPWFGSAGEMVGTAYLKQSRPELAGPLFAAIAKDPGVPETIRSRTIQMAGTLGQDAIGNGPATAGSAAR